MFRIQIHRLVSTLSAKSCSGFGSVFSFLVLFMLIGLLAACQPGIREDGQEVDPKLKEATNVDLFSNIGNIITVKGEALTSKAGAFLMVDGNQIWMLGMDEWPDELRSREQGASSIVEVKGFLTIDHKLPVIESRPVGQEQSTGMPVEPGTDLKKASERFILKNYRYKVMDN